MAWSFLLVVGGVVGWWSAPVAAHGVVLSAGGWRGGRLVVSPSRCAWRGPFCWWSAGWSVGGQPQSLRMAWSFLLAVGGVVGWWSAPVAAHGVVLSAGGWRGGRLVVSPSRCAWRGPFCWWSAGWSVGGQPQSLRMAWSFLLAVGGVVGWWSAPVAAHGVVLSAGGRRGGRLVVSPSRCAWRGPFCWRSAGWSVGGQPQSLRMAWSFLLAVGGVVGWWSAPVAAHGVVLSAGGRRGGRLVVSPSRCAWRGPFCWRSAGWSVGGQPQSLRMAWSFLLAVGGVVGWWSDPVAAHGVVLSAGGRRGGRLVVSPSRCAWRGPFCWRSAGGLVWSAPVAAHGGSSLASPLLRADRDMRLRASHLDSGASSL